jgi:transaldolase
MTMLQRLYVEQGQSPWLDNLTRGHLRQGTLAGLVDRGIRGVTANPTIFARAVEGSSDVGLTLEDSGVAGFHESFQTMIAGLAAKASQLSRR